MEKHKAGFVNIIGRPNVGKSTLMNALVGERLSIITSKAQTTRHRILGIVNGENFQVVFSDTPGIIRPKYGLHKGMMKAVDDTFKDADVIALMTEPFETKGYSEAEEMAEAIKRLAKIKAPKILIINKVDVAEEQKVKEKENFWQSQVKFYKTYRISALKGLGITELFEDIITLLPPSPPYFPKEQLTDRPERFFVAEIIREKIFTNYRQEIPYSTEVVVESFKEEETILRISAIIYVERPTQKSIIIGKGGASIKKVGTEARLDIEAFIGKKVFLELFVKVREGWRDNPAELRRFGY